MHRFWLLAALPFAVACSQEGSAPAPAAVPPPPAAPPVAPVAAAPDVTSDEDDAPEAAEATDAPILTMEPDLHVLGGAVRLRAKLTGSKLPAVFELLAERGCAADRRLSTSTIGIGMTVSLPPEDLAPSLFCPVLARTGDVTLTSLHLVAEATVDEAGYDVDHDLEPREGEDRLRLTFRSAHAKGHAAMSVGSETLPGVAADDGSGSIYTFDVPARAWAAAIVLGSPARVEVDGRTLVLRPSVRIAEDGPGDGEDEGC